MASNSVGLRVLKVIKHETRAAAFNGANGLFSHET